MTDLFDPVAQVERDAELDRLFHSDVWTALLAEVERLGLDQRRYLECLNGLTIAQRLTMDGINIKTWTRAQIRAVGNRPAAHTRNGLLMLSTYVR